MFTLLKTEGYARRGIFETVHGTIQTPFFMNVGTAAAIKGGISSIDLENLKCQVELCNTYHYFNSHARVGRDPRCCVKEAQNYHASGLSYAKSYNFA